MKEKNIDFLVKLERIKNENDLTKFAEAYKECIIMGAIDPDERDDLPLESHDFDVTATDKNIVANIENNEKNTDFGDN